MGMTTDTTTDTETEMSSSHHEADRTQNDINREAEDRMFAAITETYTSLDDLLDALISGAAELTPDLPVFGGAEPASTIDVWSWDAQRLLVTDDGDLCIIDRADWTSIG